MTSGRRQAFRDLRRQLTDGDLANPGVQKMLLDELERAEYQAEELGGYITRFHEADKRAAIMEERVRSVTAIEILFGVGVGIGGSIIGLAPLFWQDQPKGALCLGLGALLVVGATVARIVKR